jgi:Rieske 2Fe-2S family protein
VSLSDDAPDFAPLRASLEPALAPYDLRDAKIAHVSVLDEQANWKLMENGRECHHCSACHPELKTVFAVSIGDGAEYFEGLSETPFAARMRELGMYVEPRITDWWQIGRMQFNDGVVTSSLDGGPLVSKRLTDENDGDVGSLRWASEPNSFCHVTSDNLFAFVANPTGPRSARVTATWLVHKDAVEGVDYDVRRLTQVWEQTNQQDRCLVENNQRGVDGAGYLPGPYSREAEPYVVNFVNWYCATLRAYCDKGDE